MTTLRSCRGITLIELIVVIAIMGFLTVVALPNFFGVTEQTRERVDLLKLYSLRDALNRALIEDLDAFYKYTPSGGKVQNPTKLNKSLSEGFSSKTGATLFVIEVHNGLSVNVQGSHGSANDTYNICEAIGSAGTFYNALKEARFDGVADIVAARLAKKFNKSGDTYTSIPYINQSDKTDYRTAPRHPMFISRALNFGKENANTRYTMSVRWGLGSEGYSVEVFLLPNKKDWNQAFKTDHGVCFSTYGKKGCARSGK